MNAELVKILVKKKIIVSEMIVTGRVAAPGLGQIMQKTSKDLIIDTIDENFFKCKDRSGLVYFMNFSQVQSVDGMNLSRFASVYNIKADGSDQKIGKKRGRKPKNTQISSNEGSIHGKNTTTEINYYAESA